MTQKYLCCYGSPAAGPVPWGALNRNKTEIISRTTDSSIGTQRWVGVGGDGWGWWLGGGGWG